MSGVRIYDLAKELNLPNNDLIELVKELGTSVKAPSSSITDETADSVRRAVAAKSATTKNGKSGHTEGEKSAGNGASAPAANATVAEVSAAIPASQAAPPAKNPAPTGDAPQQASGSTPVKGPEPAPATDKIVDIPDVVSLKDFADLIGVPAPTIQKKLMGLGVLASLNQKLSPEVVTRLAKSYGVPVNIISASAPKGATVAAAPATPTAPEAPKVAFVPAKPRQKAAGPVARPPVVTIMGHVDHGKTTLLDAIRKTKVVDSEYGGITQHIGAYQVDVDDPSNKGAKRKITFLDTPGHEAFTAMRARGTQVTDIAVLVVAADDGVMPQTIEAINHARAAGVPIIVAVNKIDKEGANPTHVLTQLTEHNIMPEQYGGDVQTVEVSAKDGLGLDDLLETIILVSDAEVEPKADPSAPATGTVIDAKLDKGRGVVTTILVYQGTVKMGNVIVAGGSYGRIRAMLDENNKRVDAAEPARPVVVLGLGSVPNAGDRFEIVKDEKAARLIADERNSSDRDEKLSSRRAITLEELQRQIKEGGVKELNLIIKGDVHGSVEAIRQSLEKIEHPEVKVRFLAVAVGPIGESDVQLAAASEALIVGFNVKADAAAQRMAEAEHIEIREYRVIYDLFDDVKKAMAGLLEPIYEESPLGKAEVRAVFKLPRAGGAVAGSYITDGKVVRNAKVRVRRAGKIVAEGVVDTLKREKDDVREVATGYECGIYVPGYAPVEGDIIECFEMKRIERTL